MMRASLRSRARALEVLLGTGLVAFVIGACLQCVPALAIKARLAAVFVAATAIGNDSRERFASTGEWPASADPRPADNVQPGSRSAPRAAYAFEPAGPGLVARGTVGGAEQPFAISFVPAVSDGGAHVRWLCGERRAPAGWQAANAPRVLTLPTGVGYGDCRDAGEGA